MFPLFGRRPRIDPEFVEPDDRVLNIRRTRGWVDVRIAQIDRKLRDRTLSREWQDRLLDEWLYLRPVPVAGRVPVTPGRSS